MITISKLKSIIDLAEKVLVLKEKGDGWFSYAESCATYDLYCEANPQFVKELATACLEMQKVLEVFSEQENYFHDYYLFQEEINKKAKECLDKLAAMQSEGEK